IKRLPLKEERSLSFPGVSESSRSVLPQPHLNEQHLNDLTSCAREWDVLASCGAGARTAGSEPLLLLNKCLEMQLSSGDKTGETERPPH
ncbi:30S ribosomal protein S7, partial [Clarias magur]